MSVGRNPCQLRYNINTYSITFWHVKPLYKHTANLAQKNHHNTVGLSILYNFNDHYLNHTKMVRLASDTCHHYYHKFKVFNFSNRKYDQYIFLGNC